MTAPLPMLRMVSRNVSVQTAKALPGFFRTAVIRPLHPDLVSTDYCNEFDPAGDPATRPSPLLLIPWNWISNDLA